MQVCRRKNVYYKWKHYNIVLFVTNVVSSPVLLSSHALSSKSVEKLEPLKKSCEDGCKVENTFTGKDLSKNYFKDDDYGTTWHAIRANRSRYLNLVEKHSNL